MDTVSNWSFNATDQTSFSPQAFAARIGPPMAERPGPQRRFQGKRLSEAIPQSWILFLRQRIIPYIEAPIPEAIGAFYPIPETRPGIRMKFLTWN